MPKFRALFFLACLACLSPLPLGAAPLRTAVEPTWPPLEFKDSSGRIVGYSVDYFQAVCREAGCEIEIVETEWDDIFKGLRDGRWDMVASSVTITPDRRRELNFSIPYYIVRQSLMAPADSPLHNLRQLKKEHKVGVQEGTTAADLLARIAEAEIVPFKSIEEAVQALAKGDLSATVCEDVVAQSFLNNPDFAGKIKMAAIVEIPGAEELYGAAFRPDDVELLIKINDGIKAVRNKGLDREIRRKWFGSAD